MSYQDNLDAWRKRREEIWNDHVAGISYSKLAIKYGVHFTRIGKILKRVRLEKSLVEEIKNETTKQETEGVAIRA